MQIDSQPLFHVTILSNFSLGFDKYKQHYSKKEIPHSTYPEVFYLLAKDDIQIGIDKAQRLLKKVNISGDRLLLIKTIVNQTEVRPNLRNGLGVYVERNWIKVSELAIWENDGFQTAIIEDIMAQSLQLRLAQDIEYQSLIPRSVSILPVEIGCQASCSFCFSKSSISSDQNKIKLDFAKIEKVLTTARQKGAVRAVITGGGEPTMLHSRMLHQLIKLCAASYSKVVLITNGYTVSKSQHPKQVLLSYKDAGLSILSISRHHYLAERNETIMNLKIDMEKIIKNNPGLLIRLVCVLQKGGIETTEDIVNYIHWASKLGVTQVCFKELYIASSSESIYFDKASNKFSRDQQVSLKRVLDTARAENWECTGKLPWGAPLFKTNLNGIDVTIAAYTEPSVSWELVNGICRSWNLMADMNCYASLETKESIIEY